MSDSSYALTLEDGVPCGYVCETGMPELDEKDIPNSPLEITEPYYATRIAKSELLVAENSLYPSDLESRLELSAIFPANDEVIENIFDLPANINNNIRAFKRAIQGNKFYQQLHQSTNNTELALNSILPSTYLLHGKKRIKNKGSEISLIANSVSTFLSPFFSAHDEVQMEFDPISWVFKQHEDADEHKLRPDVLLHAMQHGKMMEVGCGEIKKPGVSTDLYNEDRMRVLKVMKRQLHVRLRYAKSQHEAATFGFLVEGLSIKLFRTHLNLSNGIYEYYEQPAFTMPTTHETLAHMEIKQSVE